jgi:competence protein ComEC
MILFVVVLGICIGARVLTMAIWSAVAIVLGASLCAFKANPITRSLLLPLTGVFALGALRGAAVHETRWLCGAAEAVHLRVVAVMSGTSPSNTAWARARLYNSDSGVGLPGPHGREVWIRLRPGEAAEVRTGTEVYAYCARLPENRRANFHAPSALRLIPLAEPPRVAALPLNRGTPSKWPVDERYGWTRTPTMLLHSPRHASVLGLCDRIADAMHGVILRYVPGDQGHVLDALLLGRRSAVPAETLKDFRISGTLHVLAISGLHLTLLIAIARLGLGMLRFGPRPSLIGGVALGWAYAVLVGLPASVLRAAAMATVAAVAALRQVPVSGLEVWARGLTVLVLCRPALLNDTGFQLSSAATVGLVLSDTLWPVFLVGSRPILGQQPCQRVKRFGRTLSEACRTTFVAQMFCLPILSRTFGRIPLTGMLANLVAVPLGSLAMVAGVVGLAFTPISSAAAAAWYTSAWAIHGLQAVAHLGAHLPFASLRVVPADIISIVVMYAALAALAHPRRRHLRRLAWCGLALGSLSIVGRPFPLGSHADLRLSVLDVGEGDALLLQLPDGRRVLVDGGDVRRGRDMGDEVVIPGLLADGTRSVGDVILTHPHADHAGGLITLAAERRFHRLWCGDVPSNESVARRLDQTVAARRLSRRTVSSGDTLARYVGGVLSVIAPDNAFLQDVTETTSTAVNDRSVVMRATYGRVTFLLTGDAGMRAEDEWMARGESLRCDVLKVGHHGSRWATSDNFLAHCRPRIAIISCGVGNRFGHPSSDVLTRLTRAGVEIFRTDRDGAVQCRTDGRSLWVRTARRPHWRVVPVKERPASTTVPAVRQPPVEDGR